VSWLTRGFARLTLDPSPRLRRLREEPERTSPPAWPGPLPPLPDSAYPPGAVPLDCSDPPDPRNTAMAYVCRSCGCDRFTVLWHFAPRRHDDELLEPGWGIRCTRCDRTTLLPALPDFSQTRFSG
jgi:DNA-directed RNA polymerase subunit RPC12/RpoP